MCENIYMMFTRGHRPHHFRSRYSHLPVKILLAEKNKPTTTPPTAAFPPPACRHPLLDLGEGGPHCRRPHHWIWVGEGGRRGQVSRTAVTALPLQPHRR